MEMKRRVVCFFVLAVVGILAFVTAEAGPSDSSQTTTANLEQFAWMVGSWAGTEGGVQMEEHWIHPKGGLMLGLHRDVFDSGRVFFEYLRIESTPEGIVYWASPRGQPATPFRLVESSESRAVFENPDHDWPQRLIYWREKDGSLGARVEGEKDGEFRATEWRWPRARLLTD